MSDPAEDVTLRRERFEFEKSLAERDHVLRKRSQRLAEKEYTLKQNEQRRARWNNPLALSVFAAAFGFLANATVAYINSASTTALEDRKAQQALVLEVVKTHDPDKAAENLRFLLDAKLYKDIDESLDKYLKTRKPGTGISISGQSGLQFLLVKFHEDRNVLADGEIVGTTNHILMLPANQYELSLSGGSYTPQTQDVTLSETSRMNPKVIEFH